MGTLKRGFTLIELLVVIAIIGILSSVVLTSLNAARAKGQDAAVQAELASARTQAALFNTANGANGFTNVCANTTVGGVKSIYALVLAAAKARSFTTFSRNAVGDYTHPVCNDAAAGWAAQIPLTTTNKYWCADSSGSSGIQGSNRLSSATDVKC